MKNLSSILQYLGVIALIPLLYACGENSGPKEFAKENYRLEIVDSIQIDIMANYLALVDVHDETGDLLVLKTNPPMVYIINQKGEIVKTFSWIGEEPKGVGNNLNSAEFFKDGYALMGRAQVQTYDADFNPIQSYRIPYSPKGIIYMGFNHIQEVKVDGKNKLITFFGAQTNHQQTSPEYYDEFNAVDLFDPETGEFHPRGSFHPDSHFKNGRAYYFLRPVFDSRGDKLYYTYHNDSVFYTLNLSNNQLESKYKIPFDEFVMDKGLSMGALGISEQEIPKDLAGNIRNVFKIGDLDMFNYTSGLKLDILQGLTGDNTERRAQSNKLNYNKYLIVKDGQRANTDLRVPLKISELRVVDKQGNIWATQNVNILDEEPEYITFYKLAIVRD